MKRSRMVLMTAWVLLAAGLLVQVLRPGDAADDTDQQATSEADGADPSTEGQSGGAQSGDGRAVTTADGSPTASEQAERLAFTESLPFTESLADADVPEQALGLADDPARWGEAGPIIADSAFVATVTTPGVASMVEPQAGSVQHYFPNPTQFGSDRTFLILDQTSSDEYVKVSLPVKPNGQEGWILRSDIEISQVEHRAIVDLSDDSVTVWAGDEVIVDTKAVTGRPATPTPLGVFYVRDVIPQANAAGDYGPYILALSGFSEVLETFGGGLPALAIHGTNNPGQIGGEHSSGCIRISNELITILADSVPLGTPVTIVA